MIIEQYPYIDENGTQRNDLVKYYSDGNKYILQLETGAEYEEAIDVYPCRYNYAETERVILSIDYTVVENAGGEEDVDSSDDCINM